MRILLIIAFYIFINSSIAESFNFSEYNIDKTPENIIKYTPSIYGINIDYNLKNETLKQFNNYCTIQKSLTDAQIIECGKDKSNNFITSYLKMFILVNITNGTMCTLNIKYYDKLDHLLKNNVLTPINQCRWNIIPHASAVDEAKTFIQKKI